MSATVNSEPDLRYPIGKMDQTPSLSPEERQKRIDRIAAAPQILRQAVTGLTEAQLDTPYRPGGWTVRQVVHHVADSHMNASVRFRLAFTEDNPTVKTYEEGDWANLHDANSAPVQVSLSLLDSLHERLVALLRNTPAASFARTVNHPDNGPMTADMLVSMYSWHGDHHTAHVTGLRNRMKWS
jgi:hypothetical protein